MAVVEGGGGGRRAEDEVSSIWVSSSHMRKNRRGRSRIPDIVGFAVSWPRPGWSFASLAIAFEPEGPSNRGRTS